FYFLSDTEPQSGAEAVITEANSTVNSDLPVRTDHVSYIFMEKDEQLPAEGGTYFLGASVTRSNPAAYELTLPDPASEVLNFQITGGIAIGSSGPHNYLYAEFPTGSASTLPTDSDRSRCDVTSAHKLQPYECFRACNYVGQCNLLNFDATMESATCRFNVIPSKTTFSFAAVDWVAVSYMRRNNMRDDTSALDMVIENPVAGEPISLTGVPSVRVWDITSSMHNITSYTTDETGTFALDAPDNTSIRHLIAFDPAKDQLKPSVIEVTENQNLHGMDCPDMLIITSLTFRQKAEDLAEIHREYQGIDVAVVDQQDIFNEFSSGTPHVMGVRRFVKMLSDRTPDKLKGVAMYGVASLHQGTLLNDDNVYVITAENEDPGDGTTSSDNTVDRYGNYDITRCFATDTYFVRTGATPDGLKFGSPFFRALCVPMTIVVGRIPVSSMASADAYNNKVRYYMANPPVVPAPNNSLFVSGFAERDEDMHMADSEQQVNCAIKNRGAAHTSIRAAQNMFGEKFNDQTATTRMIAGQLQRGVGFFSYFGHGNNKGFSGLWDSMQAQNHSYTKAFPIGFFGSCNTAHFDSETNGFYVDMTFKENGGTIAMVASAREVYQNYNSEFGRIFADRYFKSADGDPLGKPFINATNDITSTRNKSFICNTLAYCFIGDPMVPIYGVSRVLDISSLNGEVPANGILKPGRVNVFEGRVMKSDGTVDSDFNGTVKISVYDHPYNAVNRAKAVASTQCKPSTIDSATFDQELLIELSGNVTDGIFTAEGIVPWPQRSGSDCRISLYAYNDDRSLRGAGGYEAIAADYSSTEIVETGEYDMPEITSFELAGADEYADMEVSGNTLVRLTATIIAPAGLSISDKFCNAAKLTHNDVSMSDAVNHI
ncbi:MAG: hypothetical protein K2M97_04560, partial [Muribaculaceae bacterium]|nr:hypothetical protein [Muribaculaceae bacterium]